jgi:hypothetical protein
MITKRESNLNKLRRLRMVRERGRKETDRLTNADIEEVNERLSGTGMKYGGMKKKKMKKKKVIKANQGGYQYGTPDGPEVAKTEKEIKEKYKNISNNPKRDITISFKRQGFKDAEAKADRFIKMVQNDVAKKRTATEGSFKKGGMSKARGTGIAIRGTKFKGVY